MKAENKVPAIRFEGFSGDWEEKELGEIFTYERPDKYIVKSSEYSDEYDTPVLTANKGFLLGYTNEKSTYDKPSIIFDDFTLDCKFIDFPYMVKSSAIKILTLKDEKQNNLFFCFNLLVSTPIEIMGHARHYISVVQPTKVRVPSLKEQTAIGDYFQKLDRLINQHQQKHQQLSNLKQAMLEKMFPKAGKTTPEIRFQGFSGDWVLTSISEIADKYDHLRIPVTAKDRVEGITPYYGANGIQDYVEGYTHDGEYVLLAEDGANDLKNYPIHYVNGKVWVNNHAHVLQAKDKNSNVFLKYVLSHVDFEPFLVGGGRAKLNASVMMDLQVVFTKNIKEQTAIGNYFQKLDQLINQHQHQITKLNNIKQACLSKMFV